MTASAQTAKAEEEVEVIMTDEELFKKGCTIQLKTSVWGARKKLPKDSITVKDAKEDMFTGTKYLISREHISRMESIRSNAWAYLYTVSLDFDIKGFVYIPKKYIPDVHKKLLEFKEEFVEEVNAFVPNYPQYVEEARFKLGKLFQHSEYPDPSTIRNHFRFQWAFLRVCVPGPDSNVLPPELYIEAENLFRDVVNDACIDAVTGITNQLKETFDHLYYKISGSEAQRFQQRSIDKIVNFVNEVKHLNITNDAELNNIAERIRSLIVDVEAKNLRNDDNFRMAIANGMTPIKAELDSMLERKPRKLMI